jgi:hypothetical protein
MEGRMDKGFTPRNKATSSAFSISRECVDLNAPSRRCSSETIFPKGGVNFRRMADVS